MFSFWADSNKEKVVKRKPVSLLHLNKKTKKLAELVLQKYPNETVFDSDYKSPQTFIVNHPKKENVLIEVEFQERFVKYQRKKNPDEYRYATLDKQIGKGGQGTIFRSKHTVYVRETKRGTQFIVKNKRRQQRAVKCYRDDLPCCIMVTPQSNAASEWNIMKELPFFAVKPPVLSETSMYKSVVMMRYINGVTLWEIIDNSDQYSVDELVRITLSILDAVQDLHDRGIIHCDLKPDNIMVGKDGNIYLIDYGIAVSKYGFSLSKGGTEYYTPTFPIFMSESRDVYSIAVILKKQLWLHIDDMDISDEHKQRIKEALARSKDYYSWNRETIPAIRETFTSLKRQREEEDSSQEHRSVRARYTR